LSSIVFFIAQNVMHCDALRKGDWEVIQTAAENDTDESVVHSFGGMCAFSSAVMGQETQGAAMVDNGQLFTEHISCGHVHFISFHLHVTRFAGFLVSSCLLAAYCNDLRLHAA